MLASVNSSGQSANSFFVTIDAEPQQQYDEWNIFPTPTSGFESRYVSKRGNGGETTPQFPTNVWTLAAGTHYLTFAGIEAGTLLGTVTLMPYTTNVAPAITQQPTNTTVVLGGTATFRVTATGTAPLGYAWRFNGSAIAGATQTSYTKTTVIGADAGSYSVVITNVAGAVTSSAAVLTVTVPPSITSQPTNLAVNAGQSATFRVTASGTATAATSVTAPVASSAFSISVGPTRLPETFMVSSERPCRYQKPSASREARSPCTHMPGICDQ